MKNLFGNLGSELSRLNPWRRPKITPDAGAFPAPMDTIQPSCVEKKHTGTGGAFGSSRQQKFDRLAYPIGLQERPDGSAFMLYNFKRNVPGHVAESTVSRETVEHVASFIERGGRL